MKIRRWGSLFVVSVLLLVCAVAEEIREETFTPKYAPANMTQEEVHAFVEQLFAAATGTDTKAEKDLRSGMTDAEIEARNAANAEYREKTLPWLVAVLRPEPALEESTQSQEEYHEQEPTPEATLLPEAPPAYTTEDSYAAFAETEAGKAYLALLGSMGGDSCEKSLLITQEICGMWMTEVDHAKLAEMNEDYRCWIYAPGTQIDYPIVQSEDNSHYLKRMFNGARNSSGTLFIDYRNLPDFQDPNTLIYGHHMRNDSMFGTLTDYAEQAYFEGHPIMLVMSREEIFLLEIFAGYTTSEKDHCYDIAISDEEDMLAFLEEAQRKSDFVSGVHVPATDRLVTLSTCAYVFEEARYIAIARIVPVWKHEEAACGAEYEDALE